MKITLAAIFCLALAAVPSARADTVYLRDGSVRDGLVENHDDDKVQLRVQKDGIYASMIIPMAEVERIVINPRKPAPPATLPQTANDNGFADPREFTKSNQATTAGSVANSAPHAAPVVPAVTLSDDQVAAFQSRGFFGEMLASLSGEGPDQLNRLPDPVRDLWNQARHSDEIAHDAETLDDLRELETTMHGLSGGLERLDAISRKVRQEPFGLWLARTHCNLICQHYATGQFDLSDVREIERPFLIGLFKEKTDSALDPLRSYFPPPDPKTGQPTGFKATQLQMITTANALDLKDKAAYAAAVLLAQLKLEPDMDGMDHGFIAGQLAEVNRVLSRARDLEPAAKMAAVRAQQDAKAAAEKARREAAIASAKAATQPK